MRGMRLPRSLALSVAAVLGLTIHSLAAPANSYDINVILPLTGGVAFLGKEEKESLRLVEPVINKAGGVHGRNVHFVYYDDQTNPQTSVQLATRLMASHPTVLLGSSLVSSCNAMAPLMQNGPVMYCFSPGIHPSKGSYVFTATVSTRDLAATTIRYFRLKGWTRLAIMTSADATGQDAERGLDQLLALPENRGLKVVARARFNISDVSVSAQIERIKQARPQALIAWATGSPIAVVFKGIVQAGLNIPVATTQGNMTYAQMKQYASFLPKQLYIAASDWAPHKGVLKFAPGVEKAQKQFFGAYKAANMKPDAGSTLSWDPALIVAHALRRLGPKPTSAKLRNYIDGMKGFAGVNGVYDFPNRPQRGLDDNDVVMTRWIQARTAWQVVSGPTGALLDK